MNWRRILAAGFCGLLLTGCSARSAEPAQKALDFRTALMDSDGCRFTAAITAEYPDRNYDFTVECRYSPADGASVTVTEPEAIAGIQASVSSDGAEVVFDALVLDFGQMAEGTVSPLSAPWLLGQCWTGEYIAYAGMDEDLERVTYLRGYDEEEVSVDTWLDDELCPVRAEVAYDGLRCLTIVITDFTYP